MKKSSEDEDGLGSDRPSGDQSQQGLNGRQISSETRTLSSPEEIDRSATSNMSTNTQDLPDYLPAESDAVPQDEHLRRLMEQVESAILLQPRSVISANRHRLLTHEYSSVSSLSGHLEMLPSVPENCRTMSRSYDENVVMTSFAKLQSSMEGSSIVTTPERENISGLDAHLVLNDLKNTDGPQLSGRRDRSSDSTRRSGSLTFRRPTDGMEVVTARTDNRPSSLYLTGREDEESYMSETDSSIRNGILR